MEVIDECEKIIKRMEKFREEKKDEKWEEWVKEEYSESVSI